MKQLGQKEELTTEGELADDVDDKSAEKLLKDENLGELLDDNDEL